MKKTALLLSLAFILLVTAGILIYSRFFQQEALTIWRIIPEQAILVYESGNCESCLSQIKENPIWLSVKEVMVSTKPGDFKETILQGITGNSGWMSSLHLTQRNNFDLIFYAQADFSRKAAMWNKSGNASHTTREYSGFTIREVKQHDQVFSWTTIEDYWIGSFTPFLIEDVIRTYNSGREKSFEMEIEASKKLPVVRNDAGNLYIRYGGLNTLLNSFLTERYGLALVTANTAVLDIKPGTPVNLSGFSLVDQASNTSLLSHFAAQNPVAFSHKRFISNRSLAVINYGIDDGLTFFKNLPLAADSPLQDSLRLLASIDIQALFAGLGREISVCLLERKKSETGKVVFFDVKDKLIWTKAFDLLSKATERSDSLYSEPYGSYKLRKVDIRNLPGKLFRPLIKGFDQTYYTVSENTIFLAENPADLKRFLDDIDQEEVWGKSVSTNQFLESTLLESNVSIYFNTPLLKNMLIQHMAPSWKSFFTERQSIFSKSGLGAIQFSNLNETFYTHVIIEPSKSESSSNGNTTAHQRVQVVMRASVLSPLFSVRNHTTKQNDIAFQDSLGTLHYLSPEGKTQWSVSLDGPLAGDVKQIDFFNNGKLQLFFVTPGKLHVIDRLGNYVSPFPVSIPIQQPEFVNVIDYDNSKRYRFIISDKANRIWMLDKQGEPLEGWKPKLTDGKLIAPPRHYRIQGKDFIAAIRQDGQAYLWSRKGELVKGFPLSLDMRPEGTFCFEPGNSLSGSVFTCISKDGIKVRFTAEGKILSREPLVKATVTDQFSLVEEKSGNGYLVIRQNAKRLTIFDDDGRELVANDYVGMNKVDIRYYDFGSGKTYITVTDRDQDLCYVYDGNGNSLTPSPLDAAAVVIAWDGAAHILYADGKTLTIGKL